MVEASLPWLKWTAKALAALLAAVGLLSGTFLLLAWIGSSIPRNNATPHAEGGVEILIETNGTHTGIVMPLVTPHFDWREHFPGAKPLGSGHVPTHVTVGWGESEVFLNVPTWGDLQPTTALRIAFMGGEPVMRVSHHDRPTPGEHYRPVIISPQSYKRMAAAIAQSLVGEPGNRARLQGTRPEDAYYLARGHYTLANTCNSWVGDMLAEADIQMGLWTPFAGGVMKWIEVRETS